MSTIKDLTDKIVQFRDQRNWRQYHRPKNLLVSIMVELGELAEHFQWRKDEEVLEMMSDPIQRENVEDEIADVCIYLFLLAHELDIDLEKAILNKIRKNEQKYPIIKK